MSNTSIPYDDAQRTLSVDCPSLLIPLVNEAFRTHYPLDADVTPGGEVAYEIPVVKVQDYDLEEIFDKKLLFLLPYYFLRYQMEQLENNANARKALRQTYQDIFQRLSLLEQGGEITEFTRQSLKAMIDKVAMFRANRYEKVKEEVKEIMGGKILDYEAKDIRNKGIQMGITIGKEAGKQEGENLMGQLMHLLVEEGRIEDITRVSTDPEARQELYKEFHLI